MSYKHPQQTVVNTLVRDLKAAGFTPIKVDDGMEMVTAEECRVEDSITSVDMSQLLITKGGEDFWLMIILGNGDDELVADYTYRNSDIGRELDKVLSAHSDRYA